MIASFLAAALISVTPVQVHVETADASTVAYCHTSKALTTKVRWSNGVTNYYKNLTYRTAPFPGKRWTMMKDMTRSGNKIISCTVKADGAVYVKTKGADRYKYVPPAPLVIQTTTTPQAQPERPAREAHWNVPIILSVSPEVESDWRVADMAAAWQQGITVTTEPCGDAFACVPVRYNDLASLAAWGVAYQQWNTYNDNPEKIMSACTIELDPITPSVARPEIMAHEIGHCLGLPHWQTTEPLTVMSNLIRAKSPTSSDLEWVR